MRIVVIGATGTVGGAVADVLSERHEVVRASRNGAVKVDVEDAASIRAMFVSVGMVDAVVCCAGNAKFGPLTNLTDDDFALCLRSKLMGQVNVARVGQAHVNDGGAIVLTSGILARRPMPGSSAISLSMLESKGSSALRRSRCRGEFGSTSSAPAR